MPDMYTDVLAFHQKLAPHHIRKSPGFPAPEILDLKMKLVREEAEELELAVQSGDFVEVMDAVADLIYVALGVPVACGVDIRPVWQEVQATNMKKVGGPTRADGKILKPEGWVPPQIATVLGRQGWKPPVAAIEAPAASQEPVSAPISIPASVASTPDDVVPAPLPPISESEQVGTFVPEEVAPVAEPTARKKTRSGSKTVTGAAESTDA